MKKKNIEKNVDEIDEVKVSGGENGVEANGKALIPFLVFVGVYLGSGIILQLKGVEMAFYQFPAPLAVVIGVISAFILIKGDFNDKFDTFIKGCGDSNIIIMCIIYLLAGGFASVCKAMGGIDSTVNLGLTYIPTEYLAAGVFIISGFIATATGTSVGSAAAVGPIAIAVAEKSGTSLPLMMGCVLGGIMLGDNLSIISDTTIASTRTQGCEMKDKFKLNLWLTIIPAIITVILLIVFGKPETAVQVESYDFNVVKVLPYVLVLVSAVAGVNVFVVLIAGIIFAGGRVSPLELLPYAWFIYLLAISAIVSIFIPFSDGLVRKDPWDFEHQVASSKVLKEKKHNENNTLGNSIVEVK